MAFRKVIKKKQKRKKNYYDNDTLFLSLNGLDKGVHFIAQNPLMLNR